MPRMLSAGDIAAMKLPGMPGSIQNCSSFIARVRADHPDLVRKRAGRGGGLEVSEAALPPEARAVLAGREQVARLAPAERPASVTDLARTADDIEADQRQLAARVTGHLTGRQRLVMEARATILLAIEAMAAASGAGKDAAIRALIDSAARGTLSEAQARVFTTANDKASGASGARVSRSSIYRWFAAREQAGVAGLAPLATRQKSDLPAWFDAFLPHYNRPSKPSVAEALRAYARTLPPGAPAPAEKQVRRCLAKMPQLALMKGRMGKLAMRSRMAYTARDFSDLLPTSVYSADGKTFDAEIAHPIHGQPFRPELTTIVDIATRKVVGWSAALDESTFAVVDALRHACATAGIPAIFYTDRGPGYRNAAMDAPLTGFLARAGITPMRALPYNSQAKGAIERFNQVYTPSAKGMATYIGRDMDKEAKLLVFKTTRRELALTGTSRLLPGWDAFLAHVDRDIAAYNTRPHSSLPRLRDPQLGRNRHMTPDELWALKTENFDLIVPDADELADMFRPYVVRRTRRALVDWLGNSYFAPALEAHDGREVIVGYDIHDASRVFVREIDLVDGDRVPGRLIAVAAFEGHKTRYVPLTAERAAMEKRAKGRLLRLERHAEEARQELRPSALLEARTAAPSFPPPAVAAPATAPPPAGGGDPSSGPVVRIDGRPVFADDIAFARWCGENPSRVQTVDRAYLRDLLTTHSSNEMLRISGLDLDALRKLAREEASHPEPAEKAS